MVRTNDELLITAVSHDMHQRRSVRLCHKNPNTFGLKPARNQELGMTKYACADGRGEFWVACNACTVTLPVF
ncbi:hypothetical protein BKA82DRAFT_1004503 [Pisolithus tinctorius]|uniref:Uncharacterized protein n=1 Tax=Pisolithus tinctorius Marx 270 TaxID=870435 RepID=A0A0C3NFG0_PISTI|nr:hypothetical protein BKA82DRAFT_1004503 [Pisolithus tinctorius]KIN99779.1 hypothetical protein M404DRAFT_1004503 [Pisolithus tinctorius Marx 270]